jgi:oligopeptidase B
VHRDENARPDAVYERDLETGEDTLIYEEKDPGFFVGVSKSANREKIFVTSSNHTTSEWHWFDSSEHAPTLHTIAPRERRRGVFGRCLG